MEKIIYKTIIIFGDYYKVNKKFRESLESKNLTVQEKAKAIIEHKDTINIQEVKSPQN